MRSGIQLYNIPLVGVESEHCALIVDKGLGKIEGFKAIKLI